MMIPRIKKIISVEPYKIVCLWNTDETRVIDFTAWLSEAKAKPASVLNKLTMPSTFLSVVHDDEQENIVWPNLLPMTNADGSKEMVGLDFSPDILYGISKPAD